MIKLLSLLTTTTSLFVGIVHGQEVACKINNYSIHKGLKDSKMPIHGIEAGYIKHLGKVFDLYVPLRVGPRGEVRTNPNSDIKTTMMGTLALDAALQAKYDNEQNALVPFISAGVGAEWYDDGLKFGMPIGAGLNYKIKPRIAISLTTNYRLKLSQSSPEGFCHSLGLIFNLRDKDNPKKDPFISKMPTKKDQINEEYARLEAEVRAKNEALSKANEEAMAKKQAQLAEKAQKEAASKPDTSKPVVVSTEIKKVLDFALKGVQFKTGSAELTQESYPILDNVASTMAQNPDLRISIEGHTDRTGSESANMKLSESRAKTCQSYLISKGIAKNRLKNAGFGSTRPLSDNDDEESRSLNRRVEFVPF